MTAKRSLKVTVNNQSYLVEVDDLSAIPLTVKVNGQAYTVLVEPGEPAPQMVSKVNSPAEPVTEDGPAPQAAPPAPAVSGNERAVTAPMPGHIVEIEVQVGDRVTVGQPLCALEAMKMKNEIRAHRGGTIASVAVVSGQAVDYGQVLMMFD